MLRVQRAQRLQCDARVLLAVPRLVHHAHPARAQSALDEEAFGSRELEPLALQGAPHGIAYDGERQIGSSSSGRNSKCMVSKWYQRPPQMKPSASNASTIFCGIAFFQPPFCQRQ